MTRDFIPAKPFGEVIRNWLAARNDRTLSALSIITGLPERTLYSIRTGGRRSIEFGTADTLLTRLDQIDRWYTDLSPYYLIE